MAAVILYFVAKKFYVYEDPRVDEVEAVLPGANCGGCGYPGCHGFADACVKADDLGKMLCPVGGAPTMEKVGAPNPRWPWCAATARANTAPAPTSTTG